jgi:hypothetical protein
MDKLSSVVMARRLRDKTKSYRCVEAYMCRSCSACPRTTYFGVCDKSVGGVSTRLLHFWMMGKRQSVPYETQLNLMFREAISCVAGRGENDVHT